MESATTLTHAPGTSQSMFCHTKLNIPKNMNMKNQHYIGVKGDVLKAPHSTTTAVATSSKSPKSTTQYGQSKNSSCFNSI